MLFHLVEAVRPTLSTEPRIATPYGFMVTSVIAGSLDSARSVADEQTVLSSGPEWRRWRTDSAVAEVLIGPYSPQLPAGMSILGCQAVVWRVQATNHVTGPAFSCQWIQLPSGAEGGPDSGEGLDAQTWSIGKAKLSLGTEDGEYLAARAKKGNDLPERLSPELDVSTAEYMADGLRVPFSSLQPGELVQVHFIIAWTAPGAVDQSDTWYAVDQSPAPILRQLGVNGSPG